VTHFTGKERDSESGLDNFGARYHASTMGRFMSPDPKIPSLKHLVNPQKWNKYAYTINNPLRYFDPDGLEEIDIQLRSFIQQQSVGDPFGRRFAGDARGFTARQDVTSAGGPRLRREFGNIEEILRVPQVSRFSRPGLLKAGDL